MNARLDAEAVKKSVSEAEPAELATDEDVKRTMKKWIQSPG
jgi:hypothetical protein